MTARKALREMRAQFDSLPMPSLPHRPNLAVREDRDALQQWKSYLAYEEANPLDIEEPPVLQTRVVFAYKKALTYLRFYPEIWCVVPSTPFGGCALTPFTVCIRHLYAQYNLKIGKTDDSRTTLQSGIAANTTRSVWHVIPKSSVRS